MASSVLIVDDEKHTREGLRQALEDTYDVSIASSADEAFNLFEAQDYEVVLTDLRMPGKSGLKVIDRALSLPSHPVVIMMTAYGNIETAVEAMRRGAFDFLTKPVNLERLELLIQRALKSRATPTTSTSATTRLPETSTTGGGRGAVAAPRTGRDVFASIVGESSSLKAVLDRVRLVAPSKATVLVEGESGTGKELVAHAIHEASTRARATFVAVHCAALSENLLESELFGHEKGSFTGATERRIGRFEAADGGTIFLDEIGEISASTQVKLLRFLETKTIERVGGTKPIPLDVRLVAATNRDLERMVREGRFREDLFFRLNVVKVMLPPLRARADDVPALLEHYVAQFSGENGLPPIAIEPGAIRYLTAYPWPGNIRELRNFAENVVVLHRGGRLTEYDLEPRYRGEIPGLLAATVAGDPAHAAPQRSAEETPAQVSVAPGNPSSLSVEENEKRLLREALLKARGNRTRAAALMGISRRTLHRKIAQWPELDVMDR